MELQKEVLVYKRARESLQECERTEKIRDTIYEVAENENPIQHRHVKRFRGSEAEGMHILKISTSQSSSVDRFRDVSSVEEMASSSC